MKAIDIGNLVQINRKNQGLTQQELATKSGVGVRFIRELEHGKETCQIGKLLKVLFVLEMEVRIR